MAKKHSGVDVLPLWKLPNDFFDQSFEDQFAAVARLLEPAPLLGAQKRSPCQIPWQDDALALLFFLLTLTVPLLLVIWGVVAASVAVQGFWVGKDTTSVRPLLYWSVTFLVLALHPMPSRQSVRHSRLALALIRYFSMEMLIDWDDPNVCREMRWFVAMEEKIHSKKDTDPKEKESNANKRSDDGDATEFHRDLLPLICLACPHGVFNYGAIIWCCISHCLVGWEQYTGTTAVVPYVPGLRYMDLLVWSINADRDSIGKVLRQRGPGRTGGMLGMVPDGILGAFQCRNGVDELCIGRRRGLMKIGAQEGATILAAWSFGTTDMLTVVSDPFGCMETVSRKLQAGLLLAYGRFGLMIPRRTPVTLIFTTYKVESPIQNPTKQQVEDVHEAVYGGLQKAYDKQKAYAGYKDRTLHIS